MRWEKATEAVGLETLSCEERVQLGREITLATSNSSPGQERDRGNAASGLIRVVHGWRVRGSSTAEAVEIQSIHKEETLSAQNQPTTGARPSQPNQPWRLSNPNWATWSKLKAGSALGRVWTGCLLWSSPELFCKPMNYSPSSISAAAGPFLAKSARVPCHGPLKVRFSGREGQTSKLW